MCVLKTEYETYQNFKTSKSCGDCEFEEEENNVYIVERVDLNENDYYTKDTDEGRSLYNKIEDKKHDIAIDIRRKKMSHLSDLQKSGYGEKYVLCPETLVSFLKTSRRNDAMILIARKKEKCFWGFYRVIN